MNSTFLKFFVFLLTCISVFFILIVYKISKINYDSDVQEEVVTMTNSFDIKPYLNSLKTTNINESFPFNIFIDSLELSDLNSIKNVTALLDSFVPNNRYENTKVIVRALTEKLEAKFNQTAQFENLDTLFNIIHWANRFQNYQYFDTENSILYTVVYKHWINFVANRLELYNQKYPEHKFDTKFQLLIHTCASKKFTPAVNMSKQEKVVYNISQNKIAYLINRLILNTSLLLKFLIITFITVTLFSYYITALQLIKLFKK